MQTQVQMYVAVTQTEEVAPDLHCYIGNVQVKTVLDPGEVLVTVALPGLEDPPTVIRFRTWGDLNMFRTALACAEDDVWPQTATSSWIPITEALPDRDTGWVLIAVEYEPWPDSIKREVWQGNYDPDGDRWRTRFGPLRKGERVTHWRPNPELPTKTT